MAAIYADEIRAAFPFLPTHGPPFWPGPIVWAAVLSYLSLFVFGLSFGLNSWALTKNTDDQLNYLKANTEKLQDLIQTLPPTEFLTGFQKRLNLCYPVAARGCDSTANETEVRDGIIMVLSTLAYTVQMFDGGLSQCEYSANIMIFRSFAGLSDDAIQDYTIRAKFTEQGGAGGKIAWSGVLELEPSLAVFLKDGTARPERDRLPRFVLEIPIPQLRSDGERTAVLPGAPQAFCERVYALVSDTCDMGKECREKRALRPSVADALDDYFMDGAGRDVRSFVSIPIFRANAKAADDPIGVVNIHSDAVNMFKREAFELFVPFTAPYTLMLSRLIENFLKSPAEAHI
jgi:hypothetical protein